MDQPQLFALSRFLHSFAWALPECRNAASPKCPPHGLSLVPRKNSPESLDALKESRTNPAERPSTDCPQDVSGKAHRTFLKCSPSQNLAEDPWNTRVGNPAECVMVLCHELLRNAAPHTQRVLQMRGVQGLASQSF